MDQGISAGNVIFLKHEITTLTLGLGVEQQNSMEVSNMKTPWRIKSLVTLTSAALLVPVTACAHTTEGVVNGPECVTERVRIGPPAQGRVLRHTRTICEPVEFAAFEVDSDRPIATESERTMRIGKPLHNRRTVTR